MDKIINENTMENVTINNTNTKGEIEMNNKFNAVKVMEKLNITKTSEEDYLTKDAISAILKEEFGVEYSGTLLKKTKRDVLVNELKTLIEATNNCTDEPIAEDVNTDTEVLADDTDVAITDEKDADNNAEESACLDVQAMIAKFSSKECINDIISCEYGIASYILKRKNRASISRYTVTDIIARYVTGKSLKDSDGNNNTFTDSEIAVIQTVRDVVVKCTVRCTKTKVTGGHKETVYYINAYTLSKINGGKSVKFWFNFDNNTRMKTGKKGVVYILSQGKLYTKFKCVVEKMTWNDYCKLDNTCKFWEFC